MKLFKNLVTAVYIFDKRKQKEKYRLKKVFIPWKDVPLNTMDTLLE
jgi:hypothetical protein